MKITKFGHSCLLVEENNLKILIDPGSWSQLPENLGAVDLLLVTHKHLDHLDLEKIKKLTTDNPDVQIFTNKDVGQILDENSIKYERLEHGQNRKLNGVLIEAYGEQHAQIYPGVLVVDNTGYLIANKLFCPGDAFTNPGKEVEILALPICAPWLRVAESLDYAKNLKPKVCFPIHDGMLKITGTFYSLPEKVFMDEQIKWVVVNNNQSITL